MIPPIHTVLIILALVFATVIIYYTIEYASINIQCEEYAGKHYHNSTFMDNPKYEECMHLNGYKFVDSTPENNPKAEPWFKAKIPGEQK